MDYDDFQDLFGQAIEAGRENLTILELATAWCQNIGVTKGPLGTGMVEQMTGLPISGGSLRCDYAKAPTMFGMALAHTACDFYEQNCIGCLHRKPTEAAEHLGIWADALIAEREEQRQEQEEMLRQRMEARQRRREERRLLLGAPDPTLQSILDLIDRVDAEARDHEAERLLLSHAEVSPCDFPDELIDHMANESIAIGNGALLESVIAVFDRQGRPATDRMLKVAFDAVGRDVAAAAAGRVIAAHAERFDVDERAWDGVVLLAAGREDDTGYPFRVGAEPAPLIRLYDLAPERAAQLIGAKLGHEEVWQRATAAHAAEKLVGARSDAGPLLLPALLDAIQLPDKSHFWGDPFASGQARSVVANILVSDPSGTAHEIDARMDAADARYARNLWGCYDITSRARRDRPLPKDVTEAIFKRSIALLRQDLDPELLREVSETLKLVSRYHGESLEPQLSDIVSLVLFWADLTESYEASKPTTEGSTLPDQTMLAYSERESKKIKLDTVRANVAETLKIRAARHPCEYVELLMTEVWNLSTFPRAGRASLLAALGSVVREQALLNRVTPLLFNAIESDSPGEQEAALRAFAEIGGHEVVLPRKLTDRVLATLKDDEIGSVAAIRALSRLEVSVDRKLDVINYFLRFAQVYGRKRSYSIDVECAVNRAFQLAQGESYEERAVDLVLEIIGAFPSAESVRLLGWLPLKHHNGWPPAALHALHPDPDPSYYGIRDYERQSLLRDLAELPTNRLAPLFEKLEKIGLERLPHDQPWAWAVADVLAFHQQHERAAGICDAVVAAIPDNREKRPVRRIARQIALGHQLNTAVVKGDIETRERLLQEWKQLAGEVEDD